MRAGSGYATKRNNIVHLWLDGGGTQNDWAEKISYRRSIDCRGFLVTSLEGNNGRGMRLKCMCDKYQTGDLEWDCRFSVISPNKAPDLDSKTQQLTDEAVKVGYRYTKLTGGSYKTANSRFHWMDRVTTSTLFT